MVNHSYLYMSKPEFKVIIAGGRTFNNYSLLKEVCDRLLITKRIYFEVVIILGQQVDVIENGNQFGVDYLASCYANENGFRIRPYPGERTDESYRIQNIGMAGYADGLIAFQNFWDRAYKSTADLIAQVRSLDKLVAVIHYKNKL